MKTGVWQGIGLRVDLRSVGVGLLWLMVVVTAVVGAQATFFITLLVAWCLFPVLVGTRNTLDAGCAFMLVALGVAVVVGLAQNGAGSLMP